MRIGELFRQRVRRSRTARLAALQSIVATGSGFSVKLGGPKEGTVGLYRTRRDAEDAVHRHYNRALHQYAMTLTQKKENLDV